MPPLICLSCRGRLSDFAVSLPGTFFCEGCGTRYYRLGRVPVLAKEALVCDRKRPTAAFIDDLSAIISPDLPQRYRDELRDVFSQNVRFGNLDLQVEADQFVNRLVGSGCKLSPVYSCSEPSAERLSNPTNVDPLVCLSPTISPKKVAAGQKFSVQTRVTNAGRSTASSLGENPINVSYFCWKLAGSGITAESPAFWSEGERTPLLVDLDPGMSIIMPVRITAPTAPGRYAVKVAAVHEHVRWMEEAVTFDVEVVVGGDPLETGWSRGTELRDYNADHRHALDLLRLWLGRYVRNSNPTILELGGNAAPMIGDLKGVKLNIDVDAFGLAFGEIWQRAQNRSDVIFVAANGDDLPVPDRSVDCVAMFATFHHFRNPVELLKHLRMKLKYGGLLVLMCEPIGHVFRESVYPDYVIELRNGVNEQSFQPWEYRDMLLAAGYEIVEALIDVGSLKLAAQTAAIGHQ